MITHNIMLGVPPLKTNTQSVKDDQNYPGNFTFTLPRTNISSLSCRHIIWTCHCFCFLMILFNISCLLLCFYSQFYIFLHHVGAAPGPPLFYMTKHFSLLVSHAFHLVISGYVPAPQPEHSHSDSPLCMYCLLWMSLSISIKQSAGKVSDHIG